MPAVRVLLFAALAPVAATAAADAEQVVVQDPYLELRTGPGRGYPVFYVVERGEAVSLLRRRTDWIKVRSDRGREGWVHRAQLERTLTPQGEQVKLAGPAPESRLEHRWEVGLVTGDFGGANIVSVTGSYALTQSLHARLDVTHLLGNFSNGWMGTAGLLHAFMPQWRVSPFVSLGGGVVHIVPEGDARAVRGPHRPGGVLGARRARLSDEPLPAAGGVPQVRGLHQPRR